MYLDSVLLSRCKLIYYRLFSWMYGIVGSCAHLAMVNSSWTQAHIEKLWGIPDRIKRVYPPCDTSGLQVFILFCMYLNKTILMPFFFLPGFRKDAKIIIFQYFLIFG